MKSTPCKPVTISVDGETRETIEQIRSKVAAENPGARITVTAAVRVMARFYKARAGAQAA